MTPPFEIVTQYDLDKAAAIRAAYVRGVADGALIVARTLPAGEPNQLISFKQSMINLLLAIENVTQNEVREVSTAAWMLIKNEGGWA